ncbi:GNAT family N-acetyltransferase [Ensifer oleiphilus]|nr:GNAT family N-acetyltransferase [Ensifer oleiphilus]
MTDPSIAISNLRDVPYFADDIAERVWRAWWEPRGFPLDHIAGLVAGNLGDHHIPFAIVAHRGATFIGTASVIDSDLEERPELGPWVAAVWVEPTFRGLGLGASIVRHAAEAALATGVETIYLCALPQKRAFYQRCGWQLDEKDVGESRLDVFSMRRS